MSVLNCSLVSGVVTVPSGFVYSELASVSAGTSIKSFPEHDRLFMLQQDGRVWTWDGTSRVSYVNLISETRSWGERGLLGITLDPDFATNRFVYFFLSQINTQNAVLRYTEGANGLIDRATRTVIFEMDEFVNTNHNGGGLVFGRDGKLYISHGDGGGDFGRTNAQSLQNTFGKILRINSDGSIPEDNPYYLITSGKNRAIMALGLRNPFALESRSDSDVFIIHDVGQVSFEEINVLRFEREALDNRLIGQNFGWPISEGRVGCDDTQFSCPFLTYARSEGCAITGGTSYVPATSNFPPQFIGAHFYLDYCSGWIRYVPFNSTDGAVNDTIVEFAAGLSTPIDMAVGAQGELYVLTRSSLGVIVSELTTMETTETTGTTTETTEMTTTPTPTTSLTETTTTTTESPTTPNGNVCQPADINGDGLVNLEDLLEVVSAWGPCDASLPTCPTDVWLCDGVTDLYDILVLIDQWTIV